MKKFIVMMTLVVCGITAGAAAQESLSRQAAVSLFVKGNYAYGKGDYEGAVRFYEQILTGGMLSGPVYYNLANSYFRRQDLGRAILNYERALRMMPRDEDVRFNYQYALRQRQTPVRQPKYSFWETVLARHAVFWTHQELALITLALGMALSLVALAGFYVSCPPRMQRALYAFLGLLVMYYGSTSFWLSRQQQDVGIVLEQADARFEPREEATVHFSAAAGEKVRILQVSGEWVKVKRMDDKIGWIPKTLFEHI